MGDLFGAEAPAVKPDVMHLEGRFVAYKLADFLAVLPLQQFTATMYGKTFPAPRLECWFGLNPYKFGGRVVDPSPWPDLLLELRDLVERVVGQPFDSCFANHYRDGSDTIDWHADDEPWIGPWIASVTLGAARRFVMKHNATKAVAEFSLGHGDLLVMRPGTQAAWKHSVPRTAKPVGARLNLTFRQTVKAHG